MRSLQRKLEEKLKEVFYPELGCGYCGRPCPTLRSYAAHCAAMNRQCRIRGERETHKPHVPATIVFGRRALLLIAIAILVIPRLIADVILSVPRSLTNTARMLGDAWERAATDLD